MFFLSAIYLLSSAGILIYQSYCSCSDRTHHSIYITPKTCEDDFHVHHSHGVFGNEHETNECHECYSHTKSCGCDSPEVTFFKLKYQIANEGLKFITIPFFETGTLFINSNFQVTGQKVVSDGFKKYTGPPPLIHSPFDFLIKIQQLKIPEIA